jgi:hypothetical protein
MLCYQERSSSGLTGSQTTFRLDSEHIQKRTLKHCNGSGMVAHCLSWTAWAIPLDNRKNPKYSDIGSPLRRCALSPSDAKCPRSFLLVKNKTTTSCYETNTTTQFSVLLGLATSAQLISNQRKYIDQFPSPNFK